MMQKILFLGMGGTIAGLAHDGNDVVNYQAAQLSVGALLSQHTDESDIPKNFSFAHEQVAQVNSKDMSFDLLHALTLRCAARLADSDVHGIVITHGTDTLEETAYWLHAVLPAALQATKPVVLTCAMRPANAPNADGPGNLRDAIRLAQNPSTTGVWVQCAGGAHPAVAVQKIHSQRLNAFDSSNWHTTLALRYPAGEFEHLLHKTTAHWPWIELISSHTGVNARVVNALVSAGVQGLVVAGTGNGTLHQDLEAALVAAQTQGLPVLRSTRCAWGGVLTRQDDCLPHCQNLSPAKARLWLLLTLLTRSSAQ
jgi:L-asparaginase